MQSPVVVRLTFSCEYIEVQRCRLRIHDAYLGPVIIKRQLPFHNPSNIVILEVSCQQYYIIIMKLLLRHQAVYLLISAINLLMLRVFTLPGNIAPMRCIIRLNKMHNTPQ